MAGAEHCVSVFAIHKCIPLKGEDRCGSSSCSVNFRQKAITSMFLAVFTSNLYCMFLDQFLRKTLAPFVFWFPRNSDTTLVTLRPDCHLDQAGTQPSRGQIIIKLGVLGHLLQLRYVNQTLQLCFQDNCHNFWCNENWGILPFRADRNFSSEKKNSKTMAIYNKMGCSPQTKDRLKFDWLTTLSGWPYRLTRYYTLNVPQLEEFVPSKFAAKFSCKLVKISTFSSLIAHPNWH